MYASLALQYDPVRRGCDLALVAKPGGGMTLAIDRTPATLMLTSLGCDRRARPDDVLPDGSTEGSIAAGINPRRGWPGDALDGQGRRAGSRLWLYERAKQIEDTRVGVEDAAREALAPIEAVHGAPVEVAASWLRRNWLLLRAVVGREALSLPVRIGA